MKNEQEHDIWVRRTRRLERKRAIKNIKIILKAIWLPALIIALTLFFASCNREMHTVNSRYSPAKRYQDKHGGSEFVSWERTVRKYKKAQR